MIDKLKKLKFYSLVIILAFFLTLKLKAQEHLITNVQSRKALSLNGKWQYIVDPYETGFYDYRFKELKETDKGAYWNSDIPTNKLDRKEHGYTNAQTLMVPGDWNSQDPKFLYYEGTIWYKKSFDYQTADASNRVFLYFGAVNYRADVYLNGKKLGSHEGGFTPFNFEIPKDVLKPTDNFLVVKVDNKRHADDVPTLNTDWWNYGGITREVKLIEESPSFIQDFFIHLKKPLAGKVPPTKKAEIEGWVKLSGASASQKVTVEIPELKIKKIFDSTAEEMSFSLKVNQLDLWSPSNPKLYQVIISTDQDKVEDKIGFRTIEAFGKQVLLNGKPIFMRGISIHAEIPEEGRRAYSHTDAVKLLGWAKELNCNMVRLAHYPHDEQMTRLADSLGILVWSEIPVYWTINFGDQRVFEKAKKQLNEMITRDHNRASIIIWSVGNETPVSQVRTDFMHHLITAAKQQDDTRMISAALEVNYSSGKNVNVIDDPLGEFVDLVAFNEYLGWYGGLPSANRTTNWSVPYDKPMFISETGAGAKAGFHADSLTLWSEEFQQWYYEEQVAMLHRMPENFVGISPWILTDFRSPKRNNPTYQQGWNRKGLIGSDGEKKKAFYILKAYYDEMERLNDH